MPSTIDEKSGDSVASYTVSGTRVIAGKAEGGLHLVATPIGNLSDISLRALEVLAGVDLVACEDTRQSRRLFDHYAIKARLIPYHDHNAARQRPQLLQRLRDGAAVALISDAGTPLVSDPGYKLVRDAIDEGARVHVVPGASAALSGLLLSGLPSDRFFFEGFLPPRQAARRKRLKALARISATLIFYEAPGRLAAALADMAAVLGSREAAVSREISKFYEETLRGSLDELAARIGEHPVKGEIVITVAPPLADAAPSDTEMDALLDELLQTHSVKDAAAAAARQLPVKRRMLYERALKLKAARDDAD